MLARLSIAETFQSPYQSPSMPSMPSIPSMPSTPSKRPRLGLTLVINTLVHTMAINSDTATRFALQVTGKDAL